MMSNVNSNPRDITSKLKPKLKPKLITLVLIAYVFEVYICVRSDFTHLQRNRYLTNMTSADEAARGSEANKEFDGFNTPSVQCRSGLEQWQNNNINWWMKHPPYPLVEWIWELIDPKTNRTYYKGYFHVLLCGTGDCSTKRARKIVAMNWNWQDQNGDIHALPSTAMAVSDRHFPKILFRLDPPNPTSKPSKLWPSALLGNATISKDSIPVYDLEPYLQCSTGEKENPPPSPDIKIGACITRFWGQHDLMPEWIAYHRMVGFQHFYVFVQEPFEAIHETMPRHEPDITYIPYNYTWQGHKHNGNRSMIESTLGHHGGGESWFQSSANNQCLNLAKQHGLDWVMTHDVDEWVVVRDPSIKHNFGVGGGPSPLQQYFDKYYNKNHGKDPVTQICLHGGAWGRHPILEDPKNGTTLEFQLTLDFTYRKDRKYGNGEEWALDGAAAGGRKKCFYNVSEVKDVWVHGHLVSPSQGRGKPRSYITGEMANGSLLELNHYRSPMLGPQRRIAKPHELVSYPEFRDQYRDKLMAEMKRLNWPLPNFKKKVCKGYNCWSSF